MVRMEECGCGTPRKEKVNARLRLQLRDHERAGPTKKCKWYCNERMVTSVRKSVVKQELKVIETKDSNSRG